MSNESELKDPNEPEAKPEDFEKPSQWDIEYYGLEEATKRHEEYRNQWKENLQVTEEDIEERESQLEDMQTGKFLDEIKAAISSNSKIPLDWLVAQQEVADEDLELESPIIDRVRDAVADNPELAKIVEQNEKLKDEAFGAKRRLKSSLKYASESETKVDMEKLASMSLDEMIAMREARMPEAMEIRKQEMDRIWERVKKIKKEGRYASDSLHKILHNSVSLNRRPDGNAILEIRGKDNLKNLQIANSKPGDVFGFELVSAGEDKFEFKLVKLHSKTGGAYVREI